MEKSNTSTDLFDKIRGRFKNVTIGNDDGEVTDDPTEAKFFDFEYTANGYNMGSISVNINDDELTVIFSKDILADTPPVLKEEWFEFLKELRKFAKKRMLQFDVRDINKTNLTKRDYKFLAKARHGEDNMNESRMYGTHRTSYQKLDNARIVVKHTTPINMENSASRSQHIGSIYIESSEGERFKYPYKHLSGARAMARHVSEGGNPYDDFGNHIIGLSEELNKLRKFKTYMGKSSVMAESLNEYMDVVNGRVTEVKKTIDKLQKPAFYAESRAAFVQPVMEDVPAEIADSWVDQLTIRQFNEELKDVFPYIYRLVGETKKAKEIGPDDIVAEAGDPCWNDYKQVGMKNQGGKSVPNCVPEETEIDEAFADMLGQFNEAEPPKKKAKGEEDDPDSPVKPQKQLIDPETQRSVDTAPGRGEVNSPYVKFRLKSMPNTTDKQLVAFMGFAYGPEGFDIASPNTVKRTIATKTDLDNMLAAATRRNAKSVNVVIDAALEGIIKLKKYKGFIDKWLTDANEKGQITYVEMPDSDKEGPQGGGRAKKKGPITVVKVTVNTEGSPKIEFGEGSLAFEGDIENLHQGDDVKIVDGKYAGKTGRVYSTRQIAMPEEPVITVGVRFTPGGKIEDVAYNNIKYTGTIQDVRAGKKVTIKGGDYAGKTGTVATVRVQYPDGYKKWSKQQFKDYNGTEMPKEIQPYTVLIGNTNVFGELRRAGQNGQMDDMFGKTFRAELGGFVMTPEQLEQLKDIVYSVDWLEKYGDPTLIFPNDVDVTEYLDPKFLAKLPEKMRNIVTDKAGALPVTTTSKPDDAQAKQLQAELAWNMGPLTQKNLEKLEKSATDYSYIPRKMRNVKVVTDVESAMQDLVQLTPRKASERAIEIILAQNQYPMAAKDRMQNALILAKPYDSAQTIANKVSEIFKTERAAKKEMPQLPLTKPIATRGEEPVAEPKTSEKLGPLDADGLEKIKTYLHQHSQSSAAEMIPNTVKQITQADLDELSNATNLNAAKRKAVEIIAFQADRGMNAEKRNAGMVAVLRRLTIPAVQTYIFNSILAGENMTQAGPRVAGGQPDIQRLRTTNPDVVKGKGKGIGDQTPESIAEEEVQEGLNLKMLVLLGLTALGAYKMMDNMSATNTPLGQALQAAAEQGDTKAAMYLKKLDGLVDANNNGAVQQIAREYPPVEQEATKGKKEKPKLKLFDFILSYYDRKTGKFPKGETAILTMVEKDYGERYIEIAKKIIERIHKTYDNHQMSNNPQQMTDNRQLGRIRELAGL